MNLEEGEVTKHIRSAESLEERLAKMPSGELKSEDRFLWEGQDVEIVFKKNTCPSCQRRSLGGRMCDDCQERLNW